MALSSKPALGLAGQARRPAAALVPDLVLAPPRRLEAAKSAMIPGTAAAYLWLAIGLGLAAMTLAVAVWLLLDVAFGGRPS